jgi:hypothetical protein
VTIPLVPDVEKKRIMDSFTKKLQKGLIKTVAVGQQGLQQLQAKYDQHNANNNAAGNTYGTGQQAQAPYAYGNAYGNTASYQVGRGLMCLAGCSD